MKLENFQKIPEIPRIDSKYQAWSPNQKILKVVLENSEKSAVKHSIQKPILLNFLNLSTIFSPRLKIESQVQSYQNIFMCFTNHFLLPMYPFNLLLLMMMMKNCFCGMVDRRKAFSLISSWDHCQRSSPSRICDMPQAGFEPTQNLSSGFVE